MAGKHDTLESARRPLALQKLSGLINRGASKTKSAHVVAPAPAAAAAPAPAPAAAAAPAADKAASIFRLKTRKKDPSPDAGPKFRPLEVDLNTLSSYRLSDGWLDDKQAQKPDSDRESDKENKSPRRSRDRATSSTPIADLYAGHSVRASSPTSGQSIKGPSQHRGAARPFSFIAPQSPSYGRKSLDTARNLPSRGGSILDRPRPVEPSESVLERGRPVEPSRITGTEPEDVYRTRSTSRPTNSWRDYMPKQVPQASTATIRMVPPSTGPDDDYDPFRSDDSGSATYDPFRADTSIPSTKPGHLRGRDSLDASNRHSMYAVVPSPMSRPGTANRNAPPSRCASDQPLDRIRTWQKSVTSAPSTAGAPAAPGGLPARSASKRGVGNRLAWIRELEDKKASGAPAPAPGGFKKPSGSVADRLRMFEVKKTEAAAAAASSAAPVVPRLPPLSRTNSTASRLSSVGFDAATSSSACDNATATPRTSIDSVRTSNRASSVMSYYDPSFREKMEGLVSSYADKDDETKKQKVKASFVPVMSPKKEETQQPEAAADKVEDKAETKAEEKEAVEEEKARAPEVEKQEEKSEPAAASSEEEATSEEKTEDKPETVEPVADDKVQPAASEATPEPAAEAAKAAELPQPVEEAPAAVEAPAAAPEEKASAPQTVEEPAVAATTTATEEPASEQKEEAPVVAAPAAAPEADKATAPAADEAYQPEAQGVAEEIKFFKPEKCTLINE